MIYLYDLVCLESIKHVLVLFNELICVIVLI